MNIAICEDNLQTIGLLEKLIYECYSGDTNKFELNTFLSGEKFISHLKEEHIQYQIYILDIEMDKINGLEVASYIRQTDSQGIIIFATSHKELMHEAFEVNAFHFLLKPFDEKKVKQVILRAIESQNVQNKTFHFKIRKKINTLYFEKIEYFESFKRKIYIHSTDGIFEYYGVLKDVINQVDETLFVQVHNSYIVNMNHIKFVDANNITLMSGLKVPITKKYNMLFNTSYHNFILKRMQ